MVSSSCCRDFASQARRCSADANALVSSISFESLLFEVEARFIVLPISGRAGVRALVLPPIYPKDPADRSCCHCLGGRAPSPNCESQFDVRGYSRRLGAKDVGTEALRRMRLLEDACCRAEASALCQIASSTCSTSSVSGADGFPRFIKAGLNMIANRVAVAKGCQIGST